jgi:hypothetical protein
MFSPGGLYHCFLPYLNRAGGKPAYFLVLQVLDNDNSIVALRSTSQKNNMTLLQEIDFSRRGYLGKKISGVSYFYLEYRMEPKSFLIFPMYYQ